MADTSEINFALYGAGMVAEYHREAILKNESHGARLSAVVHYDPARFGAISDRFGVPCLTEAEALARSDIDAVCLCTPSGQHPEQAVGAAHAGKHVLVEKPMALSIRECDRMIEECDRAGVLLGVVLQRRAEPIFKRIKQAVQVGDLGNLTMGLVSMPYYRGQSYYDQAEWRGTWSLDGGGVLMNQGIHLIDLLVWFMGDPFAITGYADTLHRKVEVEDVAGAVLQFQNGALATIAATTTAEPGFPHRLEIFGTRGGIQVEGEFVRRWALADNDKAKVEPFPTADTDGAGSGGDPRGIALGGHVEIVRDFVEAIREKRRPLVSGEEGRRSVFVIESIYDEAEVRITG